MDKHTALTILHIDDTATLDEARKAYRDLAKKYHPDVNKKGGDDDGKMKQINLAFFYLAPILRQNRKKEKIRKDPLQPEKNTARPENTIHSPKASQPLSSFVTQWLKQVVQRIKNNIEHQKRAARNLKSSPVKPAGRQGIVRPRKKFGQVFKQVYGSRSKPAQNHNNRHGSERKKKRNSPLTMPFQGYQSYMAYKRKMTAAKKRTNRSPGISRVEKIQPVRPVRPVQNDSR